MQQSGPLTLIKDARFWKTDVPSGLVVFLVALPLCLGIAIASGSSAMSGIIAGIVGGLVVTMFSNSSLGVSGPAAGLVAIVGPAIVQLGFGNFLLAVVLAGVFQFALGVLKAGTIGYYFPTSVIKGMLAAIGLIIILKQIPHAFGYDKSPEGSLAFRDADGSNTFLDIWDSIGLITPSALIITLICLAILIFWESKFMKGFKATRVIQGPLVAVLAGIILNLGFASIESTKLKDDQLVRLPASIEFTFPHFKPGEIKSTKMSFGHGSHDAGHDEDKTAVALKDAGTKLKTLEDTFENISDPKVAESMAPAIAELRQSLATVGAGESTEEDAAGSVSLFRAILMIVITALTLAIVASLESLLCAEATDKLDPKRRQTDLNQELRAQGIGNVVSGLFGGLPVTQVIVRSSTNIQSGARSRFSAFVHGIFLIGAVSLIPGILNLIPLASLAAILFVVGYKLAHPSKFKSMYEQGWNQFLPFIITIAAILRTDLLIGIGIGLIASLFFILKSSYFKSLWMTKETVDGKEVHRLTLAERVFFINKGNIQTALQTIERDGKVIVDASNTVHMDQDVLDVFNDFKTHAKFDNIEIEWIESLEEGKGKDPARIRELVKADS